MKQFNKRYKTSRAFLLFWTIFIGVGAVWGAVCMFIAPDGSLLQMEQMLPYFEVLPFANVLFANYVFPGIALLLVNGVTNLIAAVLLIKNKRLGVELGAAFGVTLMLWITIQFVILPSNWLCLAFVSLSFWELIWANNVRFCHVYGVEYVKKTKFLLIFSGLLCAQAIDIPKYLYYNTVQWGGAHSL